MSKKILISPNAFKGTIEADEAARLIKEALHATHPDWNFKLAPIADGGDGTCDLLGVSLGLNKIEKISLDALGRSIPGYYFLDQDRAFIDVSTVSGIKHLSDFEHDPWTASTFGTGDLIQDALDKGAKEIILGLGGSASIDLGIGILAALGFVFLEGKGKEIPVFSSKLLRETQFIQKPIPIPPLKFTILCDVDNPFFGDNGAIPVFGPQKGIKREDQIAFENTCRRIIDLLSKKSGKAINDLPGYGAAGGIAFGLSFFFQVEITMGAKWFFDQIELEEKIQWADLIITGEGRYDHQSSGGKGSHTLMELARTKGKKIVLISSGDEGKDAGFEDYIRLIDLDFKSKSFKDEAKKNLYNSVKVWGKGAEWLWGNKKT